MATIDINKNPIEVNLSGEEIILETANTYLTKDIKIKAAGTETETKTISVTDFRTTARTITPTSGKLFSSITLSAMDYYKFSTSSISTSSYSGSSASLSSGTFSVTAGIKGITQIETFNTASYISSSMRTMPSKSGKVYRLISGDCYIVLSTSTSTTYNIYSGREYRLKTSLYGVGSYGNRYKFDLQYRAAWTGSPGSWTTLSSYTQTDVAAKTTPSVKLYRYSSSATPAQGILIEYDDNE